MGLVEAVEAREAACTDIREELAVAHSRGVRISGRSRRHMRGCHDCRDYRGALRGACYGGGGGCRGGPRHAQPPWEPLTAVLNVIGLGGSGAAPSVGARPRRSAAPRSARKVAALVCCAAVVGGTATGVLRALPTSAKSAPPWCATRCAAGPAKTSGPAPASGGDRGQRRPQVSPRLPRPRRPSSRK